MRNNPPKEIAGEKVLSVGDYLAQTICYIDSGKCESTNLSKSNVLYYDLTNDSWCCVRPSGTEPKIKFYMGVKGTSLEDADKKLNELETAMREIANS